MSWHNPSRTDLSFTRRQEMVDIIVNIEKIRIPKKRISNINYEAFFTEDMENLLTKIIPRGGFIYFCFRLPQNIENDILINKLTLFSKYTIHDKCYRVKIFHISDYTNKKALFEYILQKAYLTIQGILP